MTHEAEFSPDEIERMARDPDYPSIFEWAAAIDRLPRYEARTVSNLRLMVEWLRADRDKWKQRAKDFRRMYWELVGGSDFPTSNEVEKQEQ